MCIFNFIPWILNIQNFSIFMKSSIIFFNYRNKFSYCIFKCIGLKPLSLNEFSNWITKSNENLGFPSRYAKLFIVIIEQNKCWNDWMDIVKNFMFLKCLTCDFQFITLCVKIILTSFFFSWFQCSMGMSSSKIWENWLNCLLFW